MEILQKSFKYPELVANSASNAVGLPVEQVRMLLAILAGLPLSLAYRYVISRVFSPAFCHLYGLLSGLTLLSWTFGIDVLHLIFNTAGVYAILVFVKSSKLYVPLTFIFSFGYLLLCYWFNNTTTDYVVNWTTPQCVLCLRLIGLAFDLSDGRNCDRLREDQREAALRRRPSILETFGYAFFFGGCFVGPQFSCKRYLDFVNGNLIPAQVSSHIPNSLRVALGRLALSVICIVGNYVGELYFNNDKLLSQQFHEMYFPTRALYITFWGYVLLHKYLSVWLITEAACTICGLSYSGPPVAAVQSEFDRSGKVGVNALVARWAEPLCGDSKGWFSACSSIHFRRFELGVSGDDIISSFNLTTNRWAGQYVFRRLRFLGNRELSQVITLFFLALWHGFFTGYFMCFLIEFGVVMAERTVTDILNQRLPQVIPNIEQSGPLVRLIIWCIRKFLFFYAACTGLVGFVLLSCDRWYPIYQSMYFTGLFHFAAFPLLLFVQGRSAVARRRRTDAKAE